MLAEHRSVQPFLRLLLPAYVTLEETETRGGERMFSLKDFTAGGVRWWDALYADDSRVGGHDIVPRRPDETADD
jgi:hypothetical protein